MEKKVQALGRDLELRRWSRKGRTRQSLSVLCMLEDDAVTIPRSWRKINPTLHHIKRSNHRSVYWGGGVLLLEALFFLCLSSNGYGRLYRLLLCEFYLGICFFFIKKGFHFINAICFIDRNIYLTRKLNVQKWQWFWVTLKKPRRSISSPIDIYFGFFF